MQQSDAVVSLGLPARIPLGSKVQSGPTVGEQQGKDSCTQGRYHDCIARKDTQGVLMYAGGTDTFAHRPPWVGAHTLYGHIKHIQAVLFTLLKHQHWHPPGHQGTSLVYHHLGLCGLDVPPALWLGLRW